MSAAKGTPPSSAFVGGGEMGKLIREKDCSQTPLGPIDTWPPSLLTTVSLVLSTITSTIDFKELFEKSPGMFLVLRTDPAFTIVAATHDYLQATLTRREDIIGRPLFDVFPDNPDDLQATGTSNLRDSLQRCLANKVADTMAVQKYDIPRPASEGGGFEERYWSPVNQPVVTDDGNVEYIIHRVEDVTEFVRVRQSSALEHERSEALVLHSDVMEAEILRRSEELNSANKALRKANKQLAEFDQAKTAFFSNISHEFRTPLTLMLGPLEDELAASATLPAPHRERLELAQRNALRLLKLVNTLLDFSRIEAGRAQAHYQATDLAALTTDLAGLFRSAVERAGLTFNVDCPPLPEPLFVDHEMWEKIVLNLLSNALKHTFSGGIRVALHANGDAVELEVVDTGVGIPAAELPHLFERFHRVPGARSRTHEGSGIGLALVQGLAHLHAGSVRVASTEGQGSTFTVSLPRGRNHLPQDQISVATPVVASAAAVYIEEAQRWTEDVPAATTTVADASSPRPRILWADDNADMRNYVSRLLGADYTVTAVDNGEAAVASALAQPPDLVLTDIMMPGLDGIGVLRALRADERTRLVPVILLSARAGIEETESGLAEGADDYLVKPFTARELLARVRTHLNLGQLRRESLRTQNLANQAKLREDETRAQLAAAEESRRVLLSILEDQQRAEVASRVSRETLQITLDAAEIGYWDLNLVTHAATRSLRHDQIFGYAELLPEWYYETFLAHVHPDDRPRVDELYQVGVAAKSGWDLECRIIRADKAERWIWVHGNVFTDAAGEAAQMLGMVSDITERKRMEQDVAASAKEFRSLAESMPQIVWATRADGQTNYFNQQWVDYTGLTLDESYGAGWNKPFHPDDRQRAWDAWQNAVNSRDQYALECRLRRADGVYRWWLIRGVPVLDESGEIDKWFGTCTDIEDLKRSELKLREGEMRLNEAQRIAHVSSWEWQLGGSTIVWSDETFRIYGLSPQPSGVSMAQLVERIHVDDRPAMQTWIETCATGRSVSDLEFRAVRPNGETRVLNGRGELRSVDNADRRVMVGTVQDVTELKQYEHALHEKNAELERFTYMISHDLKSPLVTIQTFSSYLIQDMAAADAERIAKDMEFITTATHKMSRMLDELLEFSRVGRVKKQSVSVTWREVVDEALSLTAGAVSTRRARVEIAAAQITLRGERDRFVQVWQNLIDNAVKFMGEQSDPVIRIGAETKNHIVTFFVRDNGVGIDPRYQDKIFQLFEKLDAHAEGSGLGLALVKRVVETYGGTIEVESGGVGKGACFRFTLPDAINNKSKGHET